MSGILFDGVDDATSKFVTDELKKRSLNPELFKNYYLLIMKKNHFKYFIDTIDEKLNFLSHQLKLEKIDFEFSTIDKVENLYREIIENKSKIQIPFEEFELIIYTYIGESIINYVYGNWVLCSAKKDEAFETPIIVNWANNPKNMRISPFIWCELIKLKKMDIKISELIKKLIRQHNEYKGKN